jgi:hypothetical protein
MTQQDEKVATSVDELSINWKVDEIQDGIDEDMKKEVDDVMEQYKIAIQWCAPSDVSKDQGPQYAHCLAKPVGRREASFLDSLQMLDIAINWKVNS